MCQSQFWRELCFSCQLTSLSTEGSASKFPLCLPRGWMNCVRRSVVTTNDLLSFLTLCCGTMSSRLYWRTHDDPMLMCCFQEWLSIVGDRDSKTKRLTFRQPVVNPAPAPLICHSSSARQILPIQCTGKVQCIRLLPRKRCCMTRHRLVAEIILVILTWVNVEHEVRKLAWTFVRFTWCKRVVKTSSSSAGQPH